LLRLTMSDLSTLSSSSACLARSSGDSICSCAPLLQHAENNRASSTHAVAHACNCNTTAINPVCCGSLKQ
jgi:hypothetical protein